jgi:arylsulfatase A-like enzyme
LHTTATGETNGMRRPNIVFIVTDQWRGTATGYAGDPNLQTPNLDRLAAQSLNCRTMMSVCPVCTPQRASLMTGRYPTSTGMFLNDAYLPSEELCMAEILADAGYATAYIGKWHLDGHGRGKVVAPERRQGWQYWQAAECDHNYNHSHFYVGDDPTKYFWEGYDAYAQTRCAQDYLKDRTGDDAPFCLFVGYGSPHFPHATAPEEFKALYPPESIELPPNVPEELADKAREELQGYYAHCTALDRCVGDIVATLDDTGLADDTILIFTSDHGDAFGSHGVSPCQKQVAWDVVSRVPFLLRYPALHGQDARAVTTAMTTPDILPTLLGLADVGVPDTVEGEDLSGILRGSQEEKPDRAALYMLIIPFSQARDFTGPYRAVRTARHTYVRTLDGPAMLYDDCEDPHQLCNFIDDPDHAVLREKLDAELSAGLERIGDDFRDGQHYVDLWGFTLAPHGSVGYQTEDAPVQAPHRAG